MMTGCITQALAAEETLIVDGAMATELEHRGIDTSNALWSAMALISNPHAVCDVHLSYFEAGANIATTNTYQANIPAFVQNGLSRAQAEQLIRLAATEALEARNAYRTRYPNDARPLFIAGSIGPYGAYLANGSEYTGRYTLADEAYRNFHRSRMRILADAGVDIFAFETMPNYQEIRALTGLLAEEFPDCCAWISCSLSNTSHLCDGTPLNQVAAELDGNPQIMAVGANCIPMAMTTAAINTIRSASNKPIIVYPNNGDAYDPVTKTWRRNSNNLHLADMAPEWHKAGARLIGGCCRTTPNDIRALAHALRGMPRLRPNE